MVGVAQRQSTGLWPQGSRVQIPSLTLYKSNIYREAVRRALRHCARKCARQLPCHLLQITGADHMVAVKHRPAPVPRHLHRHPFRHTQIDHVSHRGPSKFVPQHPRTTCLHTCSFPGFFKVLNPLPPVWASKMREQIRDICPVSRSKDLTRSSWATIDAFSSGVR